MLQGERIRRIAKSKAIRLGELAAASGCSAGHLRRVLGGECEPSYQVILGLVARLGVDLSDIDDGVSPRWQLFHKSETALLKTFHEQFRNAREVLTVTDSIDSYLQEDSMLEWVNVEWLGVPDWDAHKEILLPYVRDQRTSRERSNFRHLLICPERLLEVANTENRDWLAQLRFGIGDFRDATGVFFVRDWGGLREAVDRHLPKESIGWRKICLVDDLTVLIHLDHERHYMCQHEEVVRQLRRDLTHEIGVILGQDDHAVGDGRPDVASDKALKQIERTLLPNKKSRLVPSYGITAKRPARPRAWPR